MEDKKREKEEERLNKLSSGKDRFQLKAVSSSKTSKKPKKDANDSVGDLNALPGKVREGIHIVKKLKGQ